MKIFVCEYITGGGLAREALPPGLAREGGMMAEALIADLGELPGVEVLASRDVRLPPLPGVETITADPATPLPVLYARGLSAADAAWPIAPETGGALETLARATLREGRCLLGSDPDAIRTAASKRATARVLRARGVPTVPTFSASDELPTLSGPWIVKPDDGAGCENTYIVPGHHAARTRLAGDPDRLIAQPWLEGVPASLSLLCAHGRAVVLAANRQSVRVTGGRVTVETLAVNGLADPDGRLAALADAVVAAMPGLWGYVGIDLVCTDRGPVVLEVNPRLTTSYCGLRPALNLNAAAMVLALLRPTAGPAWRRPAGASIELVLASRL